MIFLLFLSVVLFFLCAGRAVSLVAKKQFSSRQASVYLLLLGFYLSIFCLRLAVTLYMYRNQIDYYGNLDGLELFLDSAVHSLQTFSMDDDYTLYLSWLRTLSMELVPSAAFAAFICGLSAIQNIMAPVIGGAILLDLLSNLFPRLALYIQIFRPKYVFSELNEKTVCLAENIAADPDFSPNLGGKSGPDLPRRRHQKKCIIFTDAYVNRDSERGAELLQRAKRLGAVCLSDDVSTLHLYGGSQVTYLLMDQDETNNLNTAIALSEKTAEKDGTVVRVYRKLCGTSPDVQILFFSQNDTSADLVAKIYRQGEEKSIDPKLTVKVVREDTSLVYDILDQYPLYLPLLAELRAAKTGQENLSEMKLSILVVGSSAISREMILASYWCGQLLNPSTKAPIPLEIHVVVPGQAGQFYQEMSHLIPGVRMGDSAPADPYASIRFYSMDEGGISLDALFANHPALNQCNYVLVALDNGPKNLNIAQWLQRKYSLLHLQDGCNPVQLLYIVEDNYLCDALNLKKRPNCTALGRFADRFSTRNVFTPELEERAVHGSDKSEDFLLDEYNRRSKTASTIHARYKIFSVAPDLLDTETGKVIAGMTREQLGSELVSRYRGIKDPNDTELDGWDYLAWLEHRRWNAYTFSIGYRCPSAAELEAYFCSNPGSTDAKNITLKLHACLVDSRCTHRPIRCQDWGEEPPSEDYDELDRFSLDFNRMMQKKFKTRAGELKERAGEVVEYLKARGYSIRDGCLYGPDGACFRGLSSAENKAMRDALNLSKTDIKLLLPTDFKQYDYGCISDIPVFAIPR